MDNQTTDFIGDHQSKPDSRSKVCLFRPNDAERRKKTQVFHFSTTLARVTFFDRNIKDKQNAFNSEDSDVSFDSWTNDWKHDATLDDPLSYFLYTSSTLTG